jgi:hypothetical protein
MSSNPVNSLIRYPGEDEANSLYLNQKQTV